MSDDAPSILLTGPRPDWMPTCPQCARQVDGLICWDDSRPHSRTYEAQCHGERDTLVILESEVVEVPQHDVERWIQERLCRWQPFGN